MFLWQSSLVARGMQRWYEIRAKISDQNTFMDMSVLSLMIVESNRLHGTAPKVSALSGPTRVQVIKLNYIDSTEID